MRLLGRLAEEDIEEQMIMRLVPVRSYKVKLKIRKVEGKSTDSKFDSCSRKHGEYYDG